MQNLPERFTIPAGWQWTDRLETRPGQFLRLGWAAPENPRACIYILPGLSEYAEKYFEVAHDLLRRDFALACIDWRGQGLSWRAGDRARRHHDDFALDVADAEAFIARAPLPANLPRIMLAHSMGGQIGLRLLHDRPDLFVAAVMTAPMLGLPVPDWAGGPLAETLCAIGMDESYAPGNGPWSAERMTLGLRLLTSDPERAAMQKYWMTHKPELRMGGVTMQWVRAAFRTMRLAAQPDYLASVHTPCLMVRSGADAVIANPAIDRAARYLPNVEILPVPGALHEVMMERDQYRDLFWAGFEAFTARFI